jgi:hypothetical protein
MSVIKKININGVAYDINAQNLTDEDVTIPGNKYFSNIPKFPTIASVSDSSSSAANSAFVQAVVQAAAALKLSISALGTNWQTALAEALANAHVPSSPSALAISASESVALAQAVDITPTSGSTKHITSGGVYDAIYISAAGPCVGYVAGSANGIPYKHGFVRNWDTNTGADIYNALSAALPVNEDWCSLSGMFSDSSVNVYIVSQAHRANSTTIAITATQVKAGSTDSTSTYSFTASTSSTVTNFSHLSW